MNKAFKYRLCPTQEQQEMFAKTFGCVRFIYNKMLSDKIEYYKETKQKLNNTPAQYKKEFEWLNEVDSLALANAQMNLQSAYNNFFRNTKVGFPKFKSKKHKKNIYTTNNQNGTISIIGNHIKLPKVGNVKIVYHRIIPDDYKIKSAAITRTRSDKYFVSVLVECDNDKSFEYTGKNVGIDLGLKYFIITSEGLKISNPKYFVKSQNKLAKLQRELSRKTRGSSNYNKAKFKLAKQCEHIANQRNDFLQKLSTQLVKDYDIICTENLNVEGLLKNHSLTKSISDVSWSMFISMLTYKCDWYSKRLVKINRFYPSSKLCHSCGYKNNNLTLADRYWTCPECRTNLDRDINAAMNILNEGLRNIKSNTI